MRTLNFIHGLAVLGLLLSGCSTTKVSNRDEYEGGKLPRPGRILVYDFAATPEDLPAWSDAASRFAGAHADMQSDQLAAARKLGADLARELVSDVNDMGMTAVRANAATQPDTNDLALVGYFATIDKGSGVERVLIGFGAGAAQVQVHAEGYRDTPDGMQILGSGNVEDGGAGKGPGLVVPALVTIATKNPIGLVVSGAVKAEGEMSGRTTDVGDAKRIADEIGKLLRGKFEEQGWI
jgi:hypothetical protein